MTEEKIPHMNEELLAAWRRTLPDTMDKEASAEIHIDEADPNKLSIHITVPGRSGYTLDFTCIYLDTREVEVDFINVAKDDRPVDEHTDIIQDLIKDATRDIHECAQALHPVTHKT